MMQLSMELEKMKEYIDILDEREKVVIVKRFGPGLDKEKTQREIAKAIGISEATYQELKVCFNENVS